MCKKWIVLLLIVFLLTAALVSCKKSESGAGFAASSAPSTAKVDLAKPPTDQAGRSVAFSAAADSSAVPAGVTADAATPATPVPMPQAPDRMIVRTANMKVIVTDAAAAMARITHAVESAGGYVSTSNVWREGEVLHATLSLRVPAVGLTSALQAIRGAAVRVQSETIASEEVTQEYVDLQSQLRNLEATEGELRQLLVTVRERAKRAADILEVHQQLTVIRGQIEQARGRMRYLSQMSSFSTINVELIPDAGTKPMIEPGWQPLAVARNAARALVNALQGIADIAIWLLIYVMPIVALLCITVALAWKLLLPLRRRRVTGV
jgi:hypothetical protein